MAKSETPIKDGLDVFYQGADYSGLSKSDNYSTGDNNMKRQRQEAHQQALASEQKRYHECHDSSKRIVRSKPERKFPSHREPSTGYR